LSIAVPRWLRQYRRDWLGADLVAGLTLAAYAVPAAIGDASLANLPPQAGLYACLFSALVFWLVCDSRHTAVTVTSAISLLIGSTLGPLAGGDASRFAGLAAATALLIAALGATAWLVGAGGITSFISESVMTGFKTGIAFLLASTQLPKLCGLSGSHGDFWERIGHFFSHLAETNAASVLVGIAALGLLVLGKLWLPNRPVALFVVIGGILAAGWLDLGARGVKMLGAVPEGLPGLALPDVHWRDLNALLPLALACFLLAAVETAAIGRMFGAKHGYRVDANREFLALGAANLAAGLGSGFPVGGGMSQSLVNESAGARTPLSGLFAAGLMLAVVLFFTGLLGNLPQPVLAAIVLTAIMGLVKPATLARLWRAHRSEFFVALAATIGVLGSGILRGVLIGVILSLLLLLRRAARPHIAFLGRIPGMQRYSDLERNPDNEPIAGALLVRVEASLLYFNVDAIRDAVWARVRSAPSPVRLVVWDLSNSPHVDLAGAEMLASLHGELDAAGIRLRVVEAHADVRDTLRREGLEERLGHVSRRASLAQVVEEFVATGRA
jgi:high affinity sulfate transporter 1